MQSFMLPSFGRPDTKQPQKNRIQNADPFSSQKLHLKPLAKDTVSLRFRGGDGDDDTSATKPSYKRGLEGVIMDHTQISDVDPQTATLLYRGYPIGDLIEKSNFEETSYLVLHGALPKPAELQKFKTDLIRERPISANLKRTIQGFPKSVHPMVKLNNAVAALALEEEPTLLTNNSLEANRNKATRLIAKLPTIIAAIHRAEQNLEPIEPNPALSHAENFLYMLSGEKPDPYVASVFDKTLIAYADHGFNASTTAVRVTASTLSDMYSAVQSGIGTLKGPLHGGANEEVMRMLAEIQQIPGTTPQEKADTWMKKALAEKRTIMGFGHREYKNGDPRAAILIPEAARVGERLGKPELPQLADAVRTIMTAEMEKKGKQLPPNVDYPIGYLYNMLGLPTRLYTPIFALARVTGWTSHVTELHQDNRLYRPKADYQGPKGLTYTELSHRSETQASASLATQSI